MNGSEINFNAAYWSDVATILASIVGVVTLGIILYEMRQVKNHIQSSSINNIYNQMIEIDRFFIEHPKLKAFFYGKDKKVLAEPSESEREQLNSISEMLVDYFDNVYQQKDCLGEPTFNAKGAYMKRIYSESIALQAYLEAPILEDWYPKDFIEYLTGQKIEDLKVKNI